MDRSLCSSGSQELWVHVPAISLRYHHIALEKSGFHQKPQLLQIKTESLHSRLSETPLSPETLGVDQGCCAQLCTGCALHSSGEV